MAFARHNLAIHLLLHPLLRVVPRWRRCAQYDVRPTRRRCLLEAWILVEFERPAIGAVEALAADLRAVLAEVAVAVRDWPAMREKAASIADALVGTDTEAAAFLRWLTHDHFTFLGADDHDGHRLGLACTEELPGASDSTLLVLGRTRELSRVHRSSRLDLVGVHAASTSAMFVGLYTERRFASGRRDPGDQTKVASSSRPRAPADEPQRKGPQGDPRGVPERRAFRGAYRRRRRGRVGCARTRRATPGEDLRRHDAQADCFRCRFTCPEIVHDGHGVRIERHLQAVFGGRRPTARAFSPTRSWRACTCSCRSIARPRSTSRGSTRISPTHPPWRKLPRRSRQRAGPRRRRPPPKDLAPGLPAAYRDTYGATAAVADLATISALDDQGLAMRLQPGADGCRLKLYRRAEPIALSAVLPVLENLGMMVIDQRPFELRPTQGPVVWLADFGLRPRGDTDPLGDEQVRWQFLRALRAVLEGEVENDGFNALVLTAKLTPEQIVILRAYAKYLRQAGTTFSESYLAQTLNANGTIAHLIVELFEARLDPAPAAPPDVDALGAAITAALADVGSLDDDRILTSFMRSWRRPLAPVYQRVDGARKPFSR